MTSPKSKPTTPAAKLIEVAVFEHQRRRGVTLAAYTRYYSSTWPGVCLHRVLADNGAQAKAIAIGAHRELCMKQGGTDVSKKQPENVFRVDAQGDTLYIKAATREEAASVLIRIMGNIPESLLTWSGPMPLPEGEEALS